MTELIVDVAESTFAEEVIERSQGMPVLVDFWADWCESCKQLAPIIEKVVTDYGGAVALAKVDADAAPRITMALQIQSLPTVLLFVNGEPIDGFNGVQSAPAIQEILKRNGIEPRAKLPEDGAPGGAKKTIPDTEDELVTFLAAEPDHAEALLVLARLQVVRGATDDAAATLGRIGPEHPESRAAERLKESLEFWSGAAATGDTEPNEAAEGFFATALESALRSEHEPALAALYEAAGEDPEYRTGLARRAMVAIFGLVGETSDLTKRYQKKLANLLY